MMNLGTITFSSNADYKTIDLTTVNNGQNYLNMCTKGVDVIGLNAWTNGVACVSLWQFGEKSIYLTCDRAVTITNFRIRLRGYY